MEPHVMVMAGGTGGHIFPALAVAEWLKQQGCRITWLGSARSMEARVIPDYGYHLEQIEIRGIRGTGVKRLLLAPFEIVHALWQALKVLRRTQPELVLGMGGFVTGPGGLMASVLRIPLIIQEQNAIPGVTNRILSRVASRIFEAFPDSFDRRTGAENSGNPVRREIVELVEPADRFAKRKGPVRLLVLGGSLGARAINQALPEALAHIPERERPLVRHQAGEKLIDETLEAYRVSGVEAEIKPFEKDMAAAYDWADLVLCRAGALTVSELAAAGLGAVLVPYPHAVDDHQTHNARFLVNAGAAQLLPQDEMDGRRLAAVLQPLCGDRAELLRMAEAARGVAVKDAAGMIGRACLEMIER
ncbi:MAG: undecaprenyldiphospho-muramoylpentapeptide beta-N-acetylglucosaminyltransferase [Candidatus Thiodiazotropha sp. (ex Monitilora ramsayi)]|nr:undecaprenyldiphospho-muramoylpentapeptide beta-N-acetylglucosaminyltransferase [Candidatus Thiodiazotropha sp. (ex Monitilora ramsayi)]